MASVKDASTHSGTGEPPQKVNVSPWKPNKPLVLGLTVAEMWISLAGDPLGIRFMWIMSQRSGGRVAPSTSLWCGTEGSIVLDHREPPKRFGFGFLKSTKNVHFGDFFQRRW